MLSGDQFSIYVRQRFPLLGGMLPLQCGQDQRRGSLLPTATLSSSSKPFISLLDRADTWLQPPPHPGMSDEQRLALTPASVSAAAGDSICVGTEQWDLMKQWQLHIPTQRGTTWIGRDHSANPISDNGRASQERLGYRGHLSLLAVPSPCVRSQQEGERTNLSLLAQAELLPVWNEQPERRTLFCSPYPCHRTGKTGASLCHRAVVPTTSCRSPRAICFGTGIFLSP